MIFNVKDSPYNAYGDETHDDLAAIQAAVDAAASAGGGIVFFPPGNYKINSVWVDPDPPGDPGPRGVELKSGVVMRGSGTHNTRIFQEQLWDKGDPPEAPPSQNWSILFTQPAPNTRVSDIGVLDLTIDGGYTPNSKEEAEDFQHYHGVDLRSVSRATIQNTRIIQCAGDGIRINARAVSMSDPRPLSSTEILIENCSFDTIWRIGISLGRDYRNVRIRSCTFRNWENFIIKAEFDSGGLSDNAALCRGLTVTDCICLEPSDTTGTTSPGSISILGSPDQLLRHTTISGNFLWGFMHLGFAQGVKVEGNTLLNPTPYGANANRQDSLQLRGDVKDALIQGNHIRMTEAGGIGLRGLHATPGLNQQITLAYNTIEWIGEDPPVSPQGRGIDVVHAEDVKIEGNLLLGGALDTSPPAGIRLVPEQDDMARLSVGCNLLTSFAPAIQIHETGEEQELTEVVVSDNLLDSFEEAGLRVQQKDYLAQLALLGHVLTRPGSGAAALDVPADLTWLVAGVSGPGAADVGVWTGEDDPGDTGDPRIEDAPRGALYLDRQSGALWIRHYASGVYAWVEL